MLRHLLQFAFICSLFVYLQCIPLEEDEPKDKLEVASAENVDSYEQRVKLLIDSSKLQKCSGSDSDINECLKNVFQSIQPRLKNGIPELNIPATDPLKINRTTIQFSFGPASGQFTLKNAYVYGLSEYKIKKVDMKVKDGKLKLVNTVAGPILRIAGDYKAQVKLNGQATFKPKGKFNLTMYDVENVGISEGTFYEKDNHKFVRIHSFDTKPTIGDLKMNITGVFQDPELNELILGIAEGYWRELYRIMLPETRQYWEPVVIRITNEALSLIPYDLFVKSK